MTTKKTDEVVDDFDSSNQVPSNWVKFSVIGEDKVMGTLTGVRTMKSTIKGHEGELVKVYDLKADYGSFHKTEEDEAGNKKVIPEPIVVDAESNWSIGGKDIIDRQMKNVKVGQKVGFKFTEQTPSKTKGFAPAKIIKVFTPKNDDGTYKMDKEWIDANTSANLDQM
jgi:hypothetical protein